MNAYVPVPRDLSRVKTKIFLNLTKRQIICFGVAALLGVPSFFLLKAHTSITVAVMAMVVIIRDIFTQCGPCITAPVLRQLSR
jgi:hypothetical protein